jgi:hypothetical protein
MSNDESTLKIELFKYLRNRYAFQAVVETFTWVGCSEQITTENIDARFARLTHSEQTKLYEFLTQNLGIHCLASAIMDHTPETVCNDVIRDIRICIDNQSHDFVEQADDIARDSHPHNTHLQNVIVTMFKVWSRRWHRANPGKS